MKMILLLALHSRLYIVYLVLMTVLKMNNYLHIHSF